MRSTTLALGCVLLAGTVDLASATAANAGSVVSITVSGGTANQFVAGVTDADGADLVCGSVCGSGDKGCCLAKANQDPTTVEGGISFVAGGAACTEAAVTASEQAIATDNVYGGSSFIFPASGTYSICFQSEDDSNTLTLTKFKQTAEVSVIDSANAITSITGTTMKDGTASTLTLVGVSGLITGNAGQTFKVKFDALAADCTTTAGADAVEVPITNGASTVTATLPAEKTWNVCYTSGLATYTAQMTTDATPLSITVSTVSTSSPSTKTTAPSTKTTAPSTKTTAPSTKTSAPSAKTSAPSAKTSSPAAASSSSGGGSSSAGAFSGASQAGASLLATAALCLAALL